MADANITRYLENCNKRIILYFDFIKLNRNFNRTTCITDMSSTVFLGVGDNAPLAGAGGFLRGTVEG